MARFMHHGFTLVELLVVVTIISILAGLMLPTLEQAIDSARSVSCMSNQKQFVPSTECYCEDWSGWMPIAGNSAYNEKMPIWGGAVAHYTGFTYYTEWSYNAYWPEAEFISLNSSLRNIEYENILKCPAEHFNNNWNLKNAVSYGWNGSSWGLGAYNSHNSPLYTPEQYRRIRSIEVRRPSTTIMTGDYMRGDGGYEYKTYGFSNTASTGIVHDGGAMVLWADGHISAEAEWTLEIKDFNRNQ